MIWHIFRKDLRLTWKLALGAAVLRWLEIAVLVKLGPVWTDNAMVEVKSLIRIAAVLAACLVVVVALHHDAVPGPEQDWLMRPIRRRDMLLAKALFVLIAVQLPILLGCVSEGLALGLGFRESFLAALWQSAMLSIGFFLPLLAIAAMTANILETIVAIVAGVFTAVGVSQLASFWGWSLDNGPAGMDWIDGASLNIGLLLAGVIALGIQYRSRNTSRARFASGAVFVVGAASALLPWQTAFALQQRIAPAHGAAQNVRLIFDPAAGRYPVEGKLPASRNPAVFLPIRAEGLTPGQGIVADRVEVHLTGADGSVRILTPQLPTFASNHTWQYLEAVKALRPVPSNEPVQITADYWLTLVKETGHYSLPETGGDIRIPLLGRCSTTLLPVGGMAAFACVNAGASADCSAEAADRDTNQMAPHCNSYAPSFVWLPDWDEISRTEAHFSPSLAAAGSMHVKTYAVLDHFVRHVEIPAVLLTDWDVVPQQ